MSDNLSGRRKRGRGRERGGLRGNGRKVETEERKAKELAMTEEEYQETKRKLLRIAVIAETQYNELRKQLKKNKEQEYLEYKALVDRGECPEFLLGKAEADEKLKKKLEINETRYELKMAQIQDEYEAETAINETQHDDQYAYAKDRFITFFEELIEEKTKRQREIGLIMGALLTLPPLPTPTSQRPIFVEDVDPNRRQTRSRSKAMRNEEESSTSK
ncbi:hypothetical protein GCK72_016887 [Caenorhabditis remanei]|uniref:Uncharacterized protein n=1 Tax=Caenorhabditis remanei TaxID=31234 RepID=A0A6A5G5N3_CAERE|nr:hypothetical protein GCK72_016887 [Caenorhabditis remanei]KAF1750338.1 hypothetical protein GCK72_016887 [Caenorhabditis remanei]